MDETTPVVNPAWRKLDREVRSLTAKLHPRLARFGATNLAEPIEPDAVENFLKRLGATVVAAAAGSAPRRQPTTAHVPPPLTA